MQYRREIDGLRALAVVPVVLFHAGFQTFSGGFVGVDVFFVISGYLISTILIAELDAGQFTLTGFYERRARRILPALFLMMAVCLPFAWFWLLPQDMKKFTDSLAAVVFFVSNFFFHSQVGYFDSAAELKPLLHTWSLAVEEQFYLLFPLLLTAAWRMPRRWLLGLLMVLLLASLALAQWASVAKPSAAFFLLPARVWELLLGALLAFAMRSQSALKLDAGTAQWGSWLGLGLLAVSVAVFDDRTPFPGLYALLPTLGAGLLIVCANPSNGVGRLLGSKVLVGVGLISYSAYLWHQPLLAFARYASPEKQATWQMGLLALASFVLAFFSWRYVETPLRNRQMFSRRFIALFSVGGMLFFLSLGWAGYQTKGFADRAAMARFKVFEYNTDQLGYFKCVDPTLVSGETLNYCLTARGVPVNAVLIGDSHADDKFHGLVKHLDAYRWALIGNSSCPPVLGVLVEGDQKGCLKKFEKILDWVNRQAEVQTVVMSFFGQYPLSNAFAADHVILNTGPDTVKISSSDFQSSSRVELFYQGLRRSAGSLIAANKDVIILMDIPELPFLPFDCERGRTRCFQNPDAVLARQAEHRQMVFRLKQEFPSIRVFDPLDLFCDSQRCGYKNNDVVMYRDSHHLTLAGSDLYGREFKKWFSGW